MTILVQFLRWLSGNLQFKVNYIVTWTKFWNPSVALSDFRVKNGLGCIHLQLICVMETFPAAHKHTVTSTPKLAHESTHPACLLLHLLPGFSANEIQLHCLSHHLKTATEHTFMLETIRMHPMTTNKQETQSYLVLPSCHLFWSNT